MRVSSGTFLWISRQINKMQTKLLPIFFPRKCPFCDQILPYGDYICKSCLHQLPIIHSPICYRCGKPINSEQQELCYDCRIFPKTFERGRALFLYNAMTKKAIFAFKYENQRYLADFFVKAILSFHTSTIKSWNIQAIVPIPIHKKKRKKRGYNQAELVAKQLALQLNLPYSPDLILRKINTLPQKQFTAQARLHNLHHAFAVNPRYGTTTTDPFGNEQLLLSKQMRRILLIDDIYTTGATMECCARLLKEAGAESISIYSLCIGIARDEIE